MGSGRCILVPMRRTLGLAALWLVAAAVAGLVAWQGVAVVGDQVTDERPAPLAASEIEARLAEASATSTEPPASSTTSTTTPPTTTSPPASPTTGPTGPSPSTTGAQPPPPTTAAPPPPPPSTAPPTETRTYNLVGGTATLRFSPAGVEVVFANPAPGFIAEVGHGDGNGIRVEFEADHHESRVDGWWDGGPVDRVREDPKD